MTILLRPPESGGISQIGPIIIGPSVSLLFDQIILPVSVKWLLRVDDFVTSANYTCELLSRGRVGSPDAPHIRYASIREGLINFTIDTAISGSFLILTITNNESHNITCAATKIQLL